MVRVRQLSKFSCVGAFVAFFHMCPYVVSYVMVSLKVVGALFYSVLGEAVMVGFFGVLFWLVVEGVVVGYSQLYYDVFCGEGFFI